MTLAFYLRREKACHGCTHQHDPTRGTGMATSGQDRKCAQHEGDFVVFLIGMRINRWWRIDKWWPLLPAMNRMLIELDRLPRGTTGCLGHTVLGFGVVVQYWRSFDDLERYARSEEHGHWPAWRAFNRRMKGAAGAVGVWHETYLVQAGAYETLYLDMPPFGFGKATAVRTASGTHGAARQRLDAVQGSINGGA
jgi:hypothetical protein